MVIWNDTEEQAEVRARLESPLRACRLQKMSRERERTPSAAAEPSESKTVRTQLCDLGKVNSE